MRKTISALIFGFFLCGASSFAADHGDAPGVRLNSRLDINDVYVFQSPTDTANTVIIVTTNPVSGIISPSTYYPGARYQIVIDNDADAKQDIVFTVTFGKPDANNIQKLKLTKTVGKTTRVIGRGNTSEEISLTGGGKIEASVFDDPFFFDLLAFRNSLQFNSNGGTNFFRGLNTNAIVLEIPSSALNDTADTNIGVWARTKLGNRQIDRMGRPAINTVLVKAANKDNFNKGQPHLDRTQFGADAAAIIVSLGSSQATADSLVQTLFPDTLTFNTASSSGFLNGRALADDVIDAELQLLTSNSGASDFVSNDSTFRSTFPYIGVKNP